MVVMYNQRAGVAEYTIRNLRLTQMIQLIIGDPFWGAITGAVAFCLALVANAAPTPFEFVIAAFMVLVSLTLFEVASRRAEEPIGDSVNRGLTRVFNFPWIPSQFRPKSNWHLEPWRMTLVMAIPFLTAINSSAFTIDSPGFLANGTWMGGLILGAILAPMVDLTREQTWRALLRRGAIRT